MPIHVTIQVNEKTVRQLHIARMEGGNDRNPDKEHGYVVLDQTDEPIYDREWDAGIPFTHRYGDDITVCVKKAIDVLPPQ